MHSKLKELHNLAHIILGGEKAKLKIIKQKEQQKSAEIDGLIASGVDRTNQLATKGGSDLALFSGIDQRWELWKQTEIRKLNTQRAALLAQLDEQRLITQKAFGKEQSTQKLLDKLTNNAQVKSRRV